MQKIIYTNDNGESIELASSRPYFVQSIDGLGVPKNIIYTQKSMDQDGVNITGDDLDNRSISVTGIIIADTSAETFTLRSNLIRVLNPKVMGTLVFVSDIGSKNIRCKIEQAPVFSSNSTKNPKFVISFFCPSPYWNDGNYRKDIALWIGDFGFDLELVDGGIEMCHRNESLFAEVLNQGDVEAGVTVEFKALASLTNPSLLNVSTGEYIKINKTMTAGEIITVNTNFGNKRVTSRINGTDTNIINYLDFGSTFMQLAIGSNIFRFNADSNIDNLEVSIYYSNNYLGV